VKFSNLVTIKEKGCQIKKGIRKKMKTHENKTCLGWKHVKPPQNCNHTYNLSKFLFFDNGHHILDYFCLFKVYLISSRLHLINYFEKFNTHWKIWTYMEYIRDKIIPITEFGNLNIYFKTRVVDGILGWIF
jgi:hypothetical protein